MQLSGRLRLTTLGDLLGSLLREKLTGTLELTEEKGPCAGRVHRLHLIQGHVVQVDTQETVQRLGEILVQAGWFKSSQLTEFVQEAKALGVPLGRWLVDTGKVQSDAMIEAVLQQIRLRLERLFRVEDARITFRLVQSRRRELDAPRPLEPREYLTGRPRARDRLVVEGRPATAACAADRERQRDLLILGLGNGADELAIRSAFRRLARAYHPDSHPAASPTQIESLRRRFVEMNAAYHRLLDTTKIAV